MLDIVDAYLSSLHPNNTDILLASKPLIIRYNQAAANSPI
jgi:hypothetical protein